MRREVTVETLDQISHTNGNMENILIGTQQISGNSFESN